MTSVKTPNQKILTFLTYPEGAEEAANRYTTLFPDSEITRITRMGPGGHLPEGVAMSISFCLAGQPFIAINGGPHFSFSQGISLLVNCDTQEEVDHYWETLSEGGVQQPCGWLKDKFGVSWQVVPSILGKMMQDEDREKAGRVMQAMFQMTKMDVAALEKAFQGSTLPQ
ncbi:MAG: VOC family protein [Saprospiraceae bacterium]